MQSKTLTLLTLFAVLLVVVACGEGAMPTPAAPMPAAPTPEAAAPEPAATASPRPLLSPRSNRRLPSNRRLLGRQRPAPWTCLQALSRESTSPVGT